MAKMGTITEDFLKLKDKMNNVCLVQNKIGK